MLMATEILKMEGNNSGDPQIKSADKFITKPMKMHGESTDMVIECFLHGSPLDWEDPLEAELVSSKHDSVHIATTLDRAGVNAYAMGWFYLEVIMKLPLNVTASNEPCGAHGAALVKGNSTVGKRSATGLNSWSRLLRDGKLNDSYSKHLDRVVAHVPLRADTGPRPDSHKEWARTVVDALFSKDAEERLTYMKKDVIKKSHMLIDLEALLEILDVDLEGDGPRFKIKGFVLWDCARPKRRRARVEDDDAPITADMRNEVLSRVSNWSSRKGCKSEETLLGGRNGGKYFA